MVKISLGFAGFLSMANGKLEVLENNKDPGSLQL
jgi:hypothetical protein